MYLVLVVCKSHDSSVFGQTVKLPFTDAGFFGMCPVFETKERAEEYADGRAGIVEIKEVEE